MCVHINYSTFIILSTGFALGGLCRCSSKSSYLSEMEEYTPERMLSTCIRFTVWVTSPHGPYWKKSSILRYLGLTKADRSTNIGKRQRPAQAVCPFHREESWALKSVRLMWLPISAGNIPSKYNDINCNACNLRHPTLDILYHYQDYSAHGGTMHINMQIHSKLNSFVELYEYRHEHALSLYSN